MCVGSPTAGAWSSFQQRPDDEFETDRLLLRGLDEPADILGHQVDQHLARFDSQKRRDRIHRETCPAGWVDEDERERLAPLAPHEVENRVDRFLEDGIPGLNLSIIHAVGVGLQSGVRICVPFQKEAAKPNLTARIRMVVARAPELIEGDGEGCVAQIIRVGVPRALSK